MSAPSRPRLTPTRPSPWIPPASVNRVRPPVTADWVSDWELATASRPLCLGDIGFIIMASWKHQQRQVATRETWARDVSPSALMFVAGQRQSSTSGDTFYAAQRRRFGVEKMLHLAVSQSPPKAIHRLYGRLGEARYQPGVRTRLMGGAQASPWQPC